MQGKIELKKVLKILYEKGIKSILTEAGGVLNGAFLKENLADKIYHFIAPKTAGDNESKSFVTGFDICNINECRQYKLTALKKFGSDILLEYYPTV